MKNKPTILILAIAAMVASSACARRDQPLAATEAEPVRESAWKPAAMRTAVPQATQPPAMQTRPAATPAPQTVAERKPAWAPAAPAVTAAPMKVTVAEGSVLAVRVGERMTSETTQAGESWSGVLAEPLVVNGLVIAEQGSTVEGRVTSVQRAGRVKGVANLTVALTGFQTADGQRVGVNTSSFTAVGKDETKKDVGKVAIASGIGAAIGAIAGKGKGAAIGAGAGAAAGTGTVMAMRGGPAIISNEALIRFRVTDPVTITEKVK